MKALFYILICLGLSIGCTTEIPLETDFDSKMFIYGYLVNDSNYIGTRLQRTVPVDEMSVDPVNDATLSLYSIDESENTYLVTDDFDIEEGFYFSKDKIKTEIGKVYWIEVLTSDGELLKSDKEQLVTPVQITKVTRVNGNTRVVFKDPEGETNFYQAIFYFYENGEYVSRAYELSSDALYNGNESAFIETDGIIGDAIYVEILNLNFKTYQFYLNSFDQYDKNLDFDVEDGNPTYLFISPPPNLIGNITNITKNKMELGFFGVFSVSYHIEYF